MTTGIDLFAGLGGFTEGAEQAGVHILWAGNHWKSAVDTHAANHPRTEHALQDLQQANFHDVPDHDILLASPACQGHSRARGKEKPHHDKQRSTAWAVVSALEAKNPQAAIVENVPEFQEWVLMPMWKGAIEALGYSLSFNVVDAADYGVPQNRERLLVVCTKSKNPFVLPKADHPHVPASSIIDLDDGKWTDVLTARRSQNTIDRIASGRQRFGDIFTAPFYGSGSGKTGRSIHRPIGTITTGDRWAVIKGDKMRMMTIKEYKRGQTFRDDYKLPGTSKRLDLHLIGNAVPPHMARGAITEVLRAA